MNSERREPGGSSAYVNFPFPFCDGKKGHPLSKPCIHLMSLAPSQDWIGATFRYFFVLKFWSVHLYIELRGGNLIIWDPYIEMAVLPDLSVAAFFVRYSIILISR